MKQFTITPAAGKRLIALGVAAMPEVQRVCQKGRLVIIAGTTNGYVAEEILRRTDQGGEFSRHGFRRGLVTPPGFDAGAVAAELAGDVVLADGEWEPGRQIFDVVDDLQTGDLVLKGANAVHLATRRAAVYIGHPAGGTIAATIPAVVGRRAELIVPVGVEKRVDREVEFIAAELNRPDASGPRMLPMPGRAFTELDAIAQLTGCRAELLAGGGVYGAEGCVWIGVWGDEEQEAASETLIESISDEPPCEA
jgi:hypothetical protein